jgi:hypothetical protein
MREERGNIKGDVVVNELYTLWGMVVGNIRVIAEGKFYLRGSIYGNLTVEPGGRVHIFGNLQGKLFVMKKSKVIHSGNIGGDVVNTGGRLFIERIAKIGGKVKTKSGDTIYEAKYDKNSRIVLDE